MSILHIKLEMFHKDDKTIEYKIVSPDFNNNFKDEKLGVIVIDLNENTFQLKENELWKKYKIYPLELFDMEKKEREQLVKEQYSSYGSGMWAMKIYHYIKDCLQKKEFPQEKVIFS